jgi:hypothetical protein
MTVFHYAVSTPGVVHLVAERESTTLCGHRVYYGWSEGDETVTGVAATCITCRRRARTILRRQASSE